MAIDWDVYSEQIQDEIDESKSELSILIFDEIKTFIDNRIYFSLERMIPLIDFDKPYFTLRLSYDCAYNKEDERNVLFCMHEELENYDGGDLERLNKLKDIFIKTTNLIEDNIKRIKEEWEITDE